MSDSGVSDSGVNHDYGLDRLERVRVSILSAPIDDSVPMSFGQLDTRQACLVQLDAGGLTGLGESWINYPAWAPAERIATLIEGVAPLLIGKQLESPRDVQEMLMQRLLPVGRQWGAIGPIWQAVSAIDIALWDLLGKARGVPAANLLAGGEPPASKPPVAYASGVGPTDVRYLCEQAITRGLDAVKVKLGFGYDVDTATLATARDVLGDERTIFADANQGWDISTALEMAAVAAEYDVSWLEEPLDGDQLAELEKLAEDAPVPIATGENLYGLDNFARYVRSSAISIIQPDLAKAGGLTLAHNVAAMAAETGTMVAPHCYSSAVGLVSGLHLAAATSNVGWIEYDIRPNPLRTELFSHPLVFHGATPQLPDGAGLGVELDPQTVRRYRTHTEERTHHDI